MSMIGNTIAVAHRRPDDCLANVARHMTNHIVYDGDNSDTVIARTPHSVRAVTFRSDQSINPPTRKTEATIIAAIAPSTATIQES